MKLGALLTLFLLVISLPRHYTQGIGGKVCHVNMTLPGRCGKEGAVDCLYEFVFKYAASQMPRHATCKDVDGHRFCECDITCW